MDGTDFIVPDRRPWQSTGIDQMSLWEAVCRLVICAAVVLAPFGLLVGFAALGIAGQVPEIIAGP